MAKAKMTFRAAVFACLAFACGASAPKAARETVVVTARALVITDGIVATRYTQAAEDALEAAVSLPDYNRRMRSWDKVEQTIRVCRSALLAADEAIDAWEETKKKGDFSLAAQALLSSLRDLHQALLDAQVEIPPSIEDAIELAQAVVGTL